ncbi:MAG TPA: DUF151 domain-containing protein [Candidatus Kapabacteria bacterium]|nr:DUF151 domain-containing protein [Candidatus Kapabacteria bacterium]
MEKIHLTVLGLSAAPTSNNAYTLILKEVDGNRRLPIMIGAFEAQSIALEMEGVLPPRPMTHDLIKTILESLNVSLTEILIYDLVEGTFYAKLIFEDIAVEIDARPSDAIAIAVRLNVPIYVNSDIMDETSLTTEGANEPAIDSEEDDEIKMIQRQVSANKKPKNKLEQMNSDLDKAIKEEDYEKAASIRDEISKFLGQS